MPRRPSLGPGALFALWHLQWGEQGVDWYLSLAKVAARRGEGGPLGTVMESVWYSLILVPGRVL